MSVCLGFLQVQARRMFSSQHERWEDPNIIALVELDVQKMRVHILLNREAIRERLRELDPPLGTVTRNMPSNPVSTN
jgi:hypothetical protein